MAVGGALLKIGPFEIPYLGNRLAVAESSNPHLDDSSEMEATTPAALVEPKKKSQGPAAKAKHLKGSRNNPDFIEDRSHAGRAAGRTAIPSQMKLIVSSYVFAQEMIKELTARKCA
jgi:hypothetical protein